MSVGLKSPPFCFSVRFFAFLPFLFLCWTRHRLPLVAIGHIRGWAEKAVRRPQPECAALQANVTPINCQPLFMSMSDAIIGLRHSHHKSPVLLSLRPMDGCFIDAAVDNFAILFSAHLIIPSLSPSVRTHLLLILFYFIFPDFSLPYFTYHYWYCYCYCSNSLAIADGRRSLLFGQRITSMPIYLFQGNHVFSSLFNVPPIPVRASCVLWHWWLVFCRQSECQLHSHKLKHGNYRFKMEPIFT